MVGYQLLSGVWCIGLILGRGRGWLGGGHPSWGHTEGFRGDEVPQITPCHYRWRLWAHAGLERLFLLPSAPTNKALPLPPWRAAASRRTGVHAKPKVNCQ